jgi:hypothetical protein
MSPLEQLRAAQHDAIQEPSDAALSAYLASVDLSTVLLDYSPTTALETRMLARHQTNQPRS